MLCAQLNSGLARAKTKKPRTPLVCRPQPREGGELAVVRGGLAAADIENRLPATHTKRLEMRKLRKVGGGHQSLITEIFLSLETSIASLSHSKVGGRIPEKPFAEDVRAACYGFFCALSELSGAR